MMPEQHEQLPARLRDHDSEWWQLFDTSINVISGTVCVRCARAESNSDSAVLLVLVLVLVLRVWGHDDVGGRDRVRTVWYVDVNTHDGRYTMDDVDDVMIGGCGGCVGAQDIGACLVREYSRRLERHEESIIPASRSSTTSTTTVT